jgi:phage gp29-like protein
MRAVWEQALSNLQANQQSSMILPMIYDPDTRQPLFKLELLTNQGSKGFDTVKIKEYYKNMIFTALFADILIMGQSSTGSFALGQVKNSLTGTAAEAMVRQIKDVLNNDLIRQTYELNGWNPARACQIDFDNLDQVDLDILSKFLQRTASTGILTKDLEVINMIRSAIGVDSLPEGTDFEALLPESTTSAGKGMVTAGPGTSNSPSGADTSSNNLENAA